MDTLPVILTDSVLDELVVIRDSGLISMFDYEGVKALSLHLGLLEAYGWLEANRSAYAKGLFTGFEGLQLIQNSLLN